MQPPAGIPRTDDDASRDQTGFSTKTKSPLPVILVGASVRAAAQSAQRAGFAVTGIDRFGDVDTQQACRRYLHLSEETSPGAIVRDLPRAAAVIVSGLAKSEALLSLLKQNHSVLGSGQRWPGSRESLRRLLSIARETGVRVPQTHWPDERPTRLPAGRWLNKAAHSAGGLGIDWASTPGARGSRHCPQQQWIAGRPFGATFLSVGGSAILLAVCRSSFTRQFGRPFVYAGSSGPVAIDDSLRATLTRFGRAYAADSAVSGLFNVDLILDHLGQAWMLEVNARWSASSEVVEQALRDSGNLPPLQTLFQWHWQAITGDGRHNTMLESIRQRHPLCTPLGRHSAIWKRIVYSNRSGQFDPAQLSRISSRWRGAGIRFADLPQPGMPVRRGEPLLTVICRAAAGDAWGWREKRQLIAAVQQSVATR